MEIIKSFRGEYEFLSNFYGALVSFEGERYPSVEAAFQAAKTLNLEQRKNFRIMDSPQTARYWGRRLKLRPDWDEIKDGVMLECLRSKFAWPHLREKLLATGDAILIEGNRHGDKYWGQVAGEGKNTLGKLLMQVRDEIKKGE